MNKRFACLVIMGVFTMSACTITTTTPQPTDQSAAVSSETQTLTSTEVAAPATDATAVPGDDTSTAPADATVSPDVAGGDVMTPTDEISPTDVVTPTGEVAPTETFTPTDEVTPVAPVQEDFEILETEVKSVTARVVLNVRRGPGFSYKVIARLRRRQTVVVTGISADERWYNIECPAESTTTCWVTTDRRYVTASTSEGN
ncbi:MAG: hypothetical protein M1546_04160 [Chloroflexi bacterium]|nr:hypothetical protein [Chloroflexota bacterium]